LSIAQDVTDEVVASLALRESEERYRRLFEDSPLAMAISRDAKLVLANPALARLAGVDSPSRLHGLSLLDFTDANVRDVTVARLLLAQDGSEVPKVSRRIRSQQGREMEVELISRPFVHEGHKAVLTLVTDVTDRLAAEQRAEKSDARYRQIVESSPNGLVVSRAGVIVHANSMFGQLARVAAPEALLGRRLADLVRGGDQERAEARLLGMVRGHRAPWVEASVLREDGSEHPVEVRSEPYDHEGEAAVLTILRDISDRKAMEETRREADARHLERYRQLIEQLPDGVFVHRGEATVFANQAASTMFRTLSVDDFIGQPVRTSSPSHGGR
jgi:PAS domain S-box-containing protein